MQGLTAGSAAVFCDISHVFPLAARYHATMTFKPCDITMLRPAHGVALTRTGEGGLPLQRWILRAHAMHGLRDFMSVSSWHGKLRSPDSSGGGSDHEPKQTKPKRIKGSRMKIELVGIGHDERQNVERFIHERFSIEYNADVRHFMPNLLRLGTDDGELIAAAGYCPASEGKLFLETYLDEPVEKVISRIYGVPISRDAIVEVGNMAEAYPGGGRAGITAWTAFLSGMGYTWCVFTGVKKLRNGFRRLGIDTHILCEADPSRLDEEARTSWGRYYETEPVVMCGNIMKGYWSLRFAREILQPLWRTGLREGRAHARHGGRRGERA